MKNLLRRPSPAAVAVMLIAGCSSDVRLCEVTGTVTKAGVGQKDLLVRFSPEAGGRPATDRTDDSGAYKLKYASDRKGALVGKHRVVVSSGGDRDAEGNMLALKQLFTGEFEVKPGRNVFDIALP